MITSPQPGLFVEETALHYHLEFSLHPGSETAQVTRAIAQARQAAAVLRGPNTVWGFGPELWRALAPQACPESFQDFVPIVGPDGHSAPATQSDLWFWCHGNSYEKVWRAAYDVLAALGPEMVLDTQLSAFMGRDNRDPIGFIDGTENPELDEALAVSVIPDGGVGAGGVPVLVQKWIHDLPAFESLPVAEQEAVIGRTKADSIELDEAEMPTTSHVSRNVIEDDQGEERHIYRRNTPFGSMAEVGTMFIGCAAEPNRIDTMLQRMFGTSGDGLTDHLIRFSTPVTGSYYFVPAMGDLVRTFGELGDGDDEIGDEAESGSAEGLSSNLGIGSLLGMSQASAGAEDF